MWKLGCHSGLVLRRNGLISTTRSEGNVTGDEWPQLALVSHFTFTSQTFIVLIFETFTQLEPMMF